MSEARPDGAPPKWKDPTNRAGASIPPVSARSIERSRVTGQIVDCINQHELVRVVAPAGSGKTTAVAQAVAAIDTTTTWLILELWHQTPGRLLEGLVAALARVAPDLSRQLAISHADQPEVEPFAAAIGAHLRHRRVLLVIDDSHLLAGIPEAVAVLAALARNGRPGLRLVLVGRVALSLPGLGVEADDPGGTVGDDVLRATRGEAEEILRSHGSSVDIDEAVKQSGGWIAGLLFEAWGATRDAVGVSLDPLGGYLEREVRSRITPDDWDLLVASSVFSEVDARRAEAVGVDDARSWLITLRSAGLPAVWGKGESRMRLHPRVGELLRDELMTGPPGRRHSVLRAAARAYENEGAVERALDLYLEAGDGAEAQRLIPQVILDVLARRDLEIATRYLEAVDLEPEPAKVVLARLVLASLNASGAEGDAVLEPIVRAERLGDLISEEPRIGAFAINHLYTSNSAEAAAAVLDTIPPGHDADVARLFLSVLRDDPEAPIPSFTGDFVDAMLARALYGRGLLSELRSGPTAWAELTGTLAVAGRRATTATPFRSEFLMGLARFSEAISVRDRNAADELVSGILAGTTWGVLAEAELALRLDHDPERALSAISQFRDRPEAPTLFYRELGDTWEGACLLLADDPGRAVEVLREAVDSMRRGKRTLALEQALVYLSEAEWQLGNEDAADEAVNGAYEVARSHGSLHELLLSLADCPGVLSRRIDAEPRSDGLWHSLGRAVVANGEGGRLHAAGANRVFLREFGEATLVVDGSTIVRPRIRKSVEMLSYLLVQPKASASRASVLSALWNGRDDEATRTYLRQALRHLRDALPAGITVTATSDQLAVAGPVRCESLELETLLGEAAREPGPGRLGYLLEALALARRGTFHEGSNEVWWIDDRRARIESQLTDARLDAAEILLDAARYTRSLALVDEVLDADSLVERGWRLRMRGLGLLGDYDGVVAAYAACTAALAAIGLEPARSTTELANSLRR